MFSLQSNLIKGIKIEKHLHFASEMKLIKFLIFSFVSMNVIDLNFGETPEEIEKWDEYKVVYFVMMINSEF